MNPTLLVDAIVRQSMVFIARLVTAEGSRSPLRRLADEVFVDVVRELDRQGLGERVSAELFGMALREFRRKVARLTESVTRRGVTLCGALHGHLVERGASSRAELLAVFAADGAAAVHAVLDGLVDDGLVRRLGQGSDASYRAATAEELTELGLAGGVLAPATAASLVWVHLCRLGPMPEAQLAAELPLSAASLRRALEDLLADGRIRAEGGPETVRYATDHCLIPVGDEVGWEAALIDHHRAVLSALAAKVESGVHGSVANEELGGTTVCYDLWPGHPKEREVRELLSDTRRRLAALWDEVEEMNRDQRERIEYALTFYCGQYRREREPRQ